MINIRHLSRTTLLDYLVRQLEQFFPDGLGQSRPLLDANLDATLLRVQRCINAVKLWRADEFDHLHSTQYTIFLYYLANTIWKNHADQIVCNKLFYLNKTLNGIDCFYEIDMPEIFFIGHSVGIVLAKATYSDYLVLYQNSTVGKNHGIAPVLERGVVMYPNTAIIGRCQVGEGSVLSQGVSLINRDTPRNCLVFQGQAGEVVCQPSQRDILADIFRM